ncbi:MAG: AsmA family protein [Kiritimatiellaceae bacterium]|nr:AsmA family protein [Kiritimatiellaceae bacterium]
MKKVKKILLITGAVILVLIVVLMLSLGAIIKTAVTTAGPKLAGVPIQLAKVTVNPFSGLVHIKGLVIGNPQGFNTPSAMELSEFKVDIAMSSLLSDTIVIKQILINAPQITYEKGLKSSNLSTLQENLAPKQAAAPKAEAAPAPEKKKGAAKKVIIEDFQLNGAKVNMTITALGGKTMTLPLPDIKMKDIGKQSGGANPAEVISEVFDSITKAVVEAASSVGDAAGKALKDAGGVATDAAKGATDAAKGAADSIKKGIGGLLGK